MMLRPYRPADLPALLALFHASVHAAAGYSPAQLSAWAPETPDAAVWDAALRAGTTLIAEETGTVLGFGTILPDGYLDFLYVHKDHQRRGIGAVLCDFLEFQYPVKTLTVHASKPARRFFEQRGYRLVRSQQVERRGQVLTNYVMEKEMG